MRLLRGLVLCNINSFLYCEKLGKGYSSGDLMMMSPISSQLMSCSPFFGGIMCKYNFQHQTLVYGRKSVVMSWGYVQVIIYLTGLVPARRGIILKLSQIYIDKQINDKIIGPLGMLTVVFYFRIVIFVFSCSFLSLLSSL